jgi:hypothetical protein
VIEGQCHVYIHAPFLSRASRGVQPAAASFEDQRAI